MPEIPEYLEELANSPFDFQFYESCPLEIFFCGIIADSFTIYAHYENCKYLGINFYNELNVKNKIDFLAITPNFVSFELSNGFKYLICLNSEYVGQITPSLVTWGIFSLEYFNNKKKALLEQEVEEYPKEWYDGKSCKDC